ncbi:hypothetical protein Gotri_007405, partial [Gossypium trilobum]|nr:hypothetical protein [Gossypium trilobum]
MRAVSLHKIDLAITIQSFFTIRLFFKFRFDTLNLFQDFFRLLSFNNFKGEIPRKLANLPDLRYLYLQENLFIGRVPAELGTLENLRHLDVGNNHLVSTIRELIRIEGDFSVLRN